MLSLSNTLMEVVMSNEADAEIYQAGYTDGYDEAIGSLITFLDHTDKTHWSSEVLQEIFHVLLNGTEEEVLVLIDNFEPATLH